MKPRRTRLFGLWKKAPPPKKKRKRRQHDLGGYASGRVLRSAFESAKRYDFHFGFEPTSSPVFQRCRFIGTIQDPAGENTLIDSPNRSDTWLVLEHEDGRRVMAPANRLLYIVESSAGRIEGT